MITCEGYGDKFTVEGTEDVATVRYALRVAFEHTVNEAIRTDLNAVYTALAGFGINELPPVHLGDDP